jgi:uncharacterized protein
MNTGRSLSLIIKTVNICNMNCTYCYAPRSIGQNLERFPEEVLIKLVKGTVDLGIENVELVWHGSEPLIAGVDFFQRALEIQKEYGKDWQKFQNVMQTNATLIDDNWLQFFKLNNFGIGISLDGPADIHNSNRKTRSGKYTHQTVLERYLELRTHQCDGGICAVVNRDSLGNAERIVDFFASIKAPEVDFLPCFDSETNPLIDKKSIKADEYSQFMINAFDCWLDIDDPDFRIRFFENVIRLLMGGESQFCKFRPDKCTNFLGIDTDGSVYPCDLFVGHDYWKLGSLATDDLATIIFGNRNREFYRAMENINDTCSVCKWFRMCWGGCSLHRYLADKDLRAMNIFCQSRKDIFTHISEIIELSPPAPLRRPLKFPASRESTQPHAIYVDLGSKCNSNCYFCAADSTDKGDIRSIPEYIYTCLLEARKNGTDNLVISGGEATVHPDLFDLVACAKKNGYQQIELHTNGKLLSSLDYLLQIIDTGVTDFGMSLHGDTPELQDLITRSPGSFEKTLRAIENISLLYGPTPPLAVNCVITPENKQRLGEIVSLLISYNVSTIKLSYLHGTGRAAGLLRKGSWPTKTELQPYILNAIQTVENKGKLNTTLAIEAYPSCLLPEYEMYSSDFCITSIYRIKPDGSIQDFHTREDRQKGSRCQQCSFDSVCLGPWKEYPRLYGWDEFVPLTKHLDDVLGLLYLP